MERQPERTGEAGRRNDAALDEVRRLFARYRSRPRRPVERGEPRSSKQAQRDADHPQATARP